MAVWGTLRAMPVPELLQWIGMARKTGMLEVRVDGTASRMAFEQGELVWSATDNPNRTLGQRLVAGGVINDDIHLHARKVREECDIAYAQVLNEMNAVHQDDLVRYLRLKAEDELYELFLTTEGEFQFSECEIPELSRLPLRVDLTRAVMRVTQRVDEGAAFDPDDTMTRARKQQR